jgi:hypothetical protein
VNPNRLPGGFTTNFTALDIAGFYRLTTSQRVNVPEPQYNARLPRTNLTVVLKPESELIEIGSPVTFVALVSGYDPTNAAQLKYQWQWNKDPYSEVPGNVNLTWRDLQIGSNTNFVTIPDSPTDSNFLTIQSVSTNDVAFYRVIVTVPGPRSNIVFTAMSDAAPLWAWETTNSIFAWGTAVRTSGSGDGCPGSYTRRVDFGLGYYPIQPGPYGAADGYSRSSFVYWYDAVGDAGCGAGGSVSVAVQFPTLTHYFAIFTTDTDHNPYPIYLHNFR